MIIIIKPSPGSDQHLHRSVCIEHLPNDLEPAQALVVAIDALQAAGYGLADLLEAVVDMVDSIKAKQQPPDGAGIVLTDN